MKPPKKHPRFMMQIIANAGSGVSIFEQTATGTNDNEATIKLLGTSHSHAAIIIPKMK